MNNLPNSLPAVSSSKLTTLMQNVANTANVLVYALEGRVDDMNDYGVQAWSKISSEYFDIVVRNILKLKVHLSELHTFLLKGQITHHDKQEVLLWLDEVVDGIMYRMRNNLYFRDTFTIPMGELLHDVANIKAS